ncbi:Uma2 family endonuclease [Benzoatithermus flavus]|uniref:Uma2 family endonuclease n=1 Tax=Benzoatithermus flavus TaxID=3108223 RepID=A0ABU8XPR1_9PROT
MGEPALPVFHDVEAFLAWEERREERYEFVGGVLTPMAGGTENHDLISANAIGALYDRLRGSPCRAHGSNLKVRSPVGAIMYPDAFVRCGHAQGGRTVVDDPVLVVEVLSPGTQQATSPASAGLTRPSPACRRSCSSPPTSRASNSPSAAPTGAGSRATMPASMRRCLSPPWTSSCRSPISMRARRWSLNLC